MALVSAILTAVGYRIFRDGTTITTSSSPSSTECIQWINEDIITIAGLCAQEKSELGRTLGSITTVDGTASYSDFASSIMTTSEYGFILKTNSRDRIELTTMDSLLDYSPSTT